MSRLYTLSAPQRPMWQSHPHRMSETTRRWVHGPVRSDLDREPLSGAVIAIGIIGNLTMWAGLAAYLFGGN